MSKPNKWLRYLPAGVGIVLVALIAVGVFFLKDLFQKPPQTKKQVQQVTIIQPPPPPPPPPEQPPPPPEVKEEKIEEPEPEKEPEPAPEEADEPPAETLGVDAEGGAGSDAFGLAGRKGGRGLLGGAPGSAVIWYGGQIKRGVEDELQSLLADTPARQSSYSIQLEVWVDASGKLRAELASGSGKADVDQAIKSALARLRVTLPKAPPEGMPQPVKIRVTSRI